MKPIEEIRAAFQLIHRVATGQSDRAYMSIPADPDRDADLIVSAALDELEALRRQVARAQELQRGAEAQHCAALARVEELEGHLAQYAKALRELVRVVSHQLARGEDPEEGAFDRAWVAACAALREEPPPKEPRAMWHSAARYVGWLPPDEVERHIAKRFSEVLKLHVEDLRGEELDRKVRELVSKDMYPPGVPVVWGRLRD